MDDQDDHSTEEATATQACDSTANYERWGIGCDATDQRPELEDADANQINPFGVVEGVYPAADKLEAAHSQEVGRRIPADILQRVEMVGDDWDCRGNDGSVEGDKENCNETSSHHNIDGGLRRVLIFCWRLLD